MCDSVILRSRLLRGVYTCIPSWRIQVCDAPDDFTPHYVHDADIINCEQLCTVWQQATRSGFGPPSIQVANKRQAHCYQPPIYFNLESPSKTGVFIASVHGLVNLTLLALGYKPALSGVADPYPSWGHTPSNTRDWSIKHRSLKKWAQAKCSVPRSWSVFFLINIIQSKSVRPYAKYTSISVVGARTTSPYWPVLRIHVLPHPAARFIASTGRCCNALLAITIVLELHVCGIFGDLQLIIGRCCEPINWDLGRQVDWWSQLMVGQPTCEANRARSVLTGRGGPTDEGQKFTPYYATILLESMTTQ